MSLFAFIRLILILSPNANHVWRNFVEWDAGRSGRGPVETADILGKVQQ